MFPADALHALLRHTAAHHRRETIAFGRRLNAVMERLFLTAIWRNFVKGRSERRPDPTTPAMRLGLATERWSWRRVLARRLFPKREILPPGWRDLYRRRWITPTLPSNTRHRPPLLGVYPGPHLRNGGERRHMTRHTITPDRLLDVYAGHLGPEYIAREDETNRELLGQSNNPRTGPPFPFHVL